MHQKIPFQFISAVRIRQTKRHLASLIVWAEAKGQPMTAQEAADALGMKRETVIKYLYDAPAMFKRRKDWRWVRRPAPGEPDSNA